MIDKKFAKRSKMMKKLIPFLFVFIGQFSLGQNATVTVFDADDAEEINVESETVLKNAVKWNWSLLARGVFMLNYERELKPWVSVEAGLGLCYRDIMFEGMDEFLLQDNVMYSDEATAVIKPAVEGRVRFYPFQLNDMEGFYCSLGYLNRNYQTETAIEQETYETTYQFNESQFLIGWQYESWWLNNILADVYFGVGLRGYETSTYESQYANGSTDYVRVDDKGSKPAFYLGFKLSVPF
jgi:hypothetical protein